MEDSTYEEVVDREGSLKVGEATGMMSGYIPSKSNGNSDSIAVTWWKGVGGGWKKKETQSVAWQEDGQGQDSTRRKFQNQAVWILQGNGDTGRQWRLLQ